MNTKTKQIVMAALIAALACIATMIIKIPSPLKGYINLGDCVVLLAGWMLLPAYGFLAFKSPGFLSKDSSRASTAVCQSSTAMAASPIL